MSNQYNISDLIQVGDEYCIVIDIKRKTGWSEIEVLHQGVAIIVIDDGRRNDIKVIKGNKI